MTSDFSLINKTKSKIPLLPFVYLKNKILGKRYSLSVAYIGSTKIKELNLRYRKKNKPTNILSFALTKSSGELLLCPAVIKKELKKFDQNLPELMTFLIIHGMLHLKGYEHGEKMEKAEKKYLSHTKF